jgi:hypothetical protein
MCWDGGRRNASHRPRIRIDVFDEEPDEYASADMLMRLLCLLILSVTRHDTVHGCALSINYP